MLNQRQFNNVEDTALDAANSKYSAVQQGYYVDPYIGYFVYDSKKQIPPMNLGYHLRALAILYAVKKFYSIHGSNSQVVILGCGYDTLFWRLRDENIRFAKWIDLDMQDVVQKKMRIIGNDIFAPIDNYFLSECNLEDHNNFKEVLQQGGFQDLPTIFVDECTLIYVDPNAVDQIISYASALSDSSFISYAMIKPDDRFGQMMIQNFNSFNAPLKGITVYKTSESYKQRFLTFGFKNADAYDLNKAMKLIITPSMLAKLRKLEMQDDPEELSYMLMHYVLAIASSQPSFLEFFKQ